MLRISICDDEQDMLSKVQEVTELFFRTHCVDYSINTYQELLCKGWFLPSNTYDCGSFVVN